MCEQDWKELKEKLFEKYRQQGYTDEQLRPVWDAMEEAINILRDDFESRVAARNNFDRWKMGLTPDAFVNKRNELAIHCAICPAAGACNSPNGSCVKNFMDWSYSEE